MFIKLIIYLISVVQIVTDYTYLSPVIPIDAIQNNKYQSSKSEHDLFLFTIPVDNSFQSTWYHLYLLMVNTTFREHVITNDDKLADENNSRFIRKMHFSYESCENCKLQLTHFAPIEFDLSCLLSNPSRQNRVQTVYNPSTHFNNIGNSFIDINSPLVESLVDFINQQSNSFRFSNGSHNEVGKLLSETELFQTNSLESDTCRHIDYNELMTNPNVFIEEYWLPQRPVVIENYPVNISISSISHLLPFLNSRVGCKLSPSNDYEGIDNLLNWGMSSMQYVPRKVLDQMQSPDLVVVRAAHVEMDLEDALDLISNTNVGWEESNYNYSNDVKTYIEYQSTNSFPGLLDGLLPKEVLPSGLHKVLKDGKAYLWSFFTFSSVMQDLLSL